METSRLQIVDALRGFAIVSIMLLHNLEHFDFYFTPENLPLWIQASDKIIWDTLFFLFSGKSYAIFALLFGLTFYIQDSNQQKNGRDFRVRFAWRLLLLLLFGIINSAFYEGDILTIYAILGFALIPVARLSNKVVLIIALLLMLQPFELLKLFYVLLIDKSTAVSDPASWAYFGKMGEYITGTNLWDTLYGNLTNGKTAVLIWTWEVGRVPQTISLFLLGMLAGRFKLFVYSVEMIRFWWKILLSVIVLFLVFWFISLYLGQIFSNKAALRSAETILKTWSNLSFMLFLVSGFVLLYQYIKLNKVLNVLSPIGRMSLSNYMIQSIVGSFIYYGFGLGLYKYTGATYCLLIGIILAVMQGIFSKWWMKNHRQGPLETIWHRLTWIGSRKG